MIMIMNFFGPVFDPFIVLFVFMYIIMVCDTVSTRVLMFFRV